MVFCLSRMSNLLQKVSSHENVPANGVTGLAVSPAAEQDLPAGGTARWCIVLGAFLAQICGYGYTNSFGVYQAYYSQQYLTNESASTISWIGSSATFLGTGMGALCGPLFDRGYFYPVWIGGAVLRSFSIFMLSLAKPGNYYQVLLSQGLAFGIGQGMMYAPSLAILSHYFKRRRPAMMSVVSSGAALGGVVHPIMLNKLLNSSMSFGTAVRISAAFLTALLFLSCILVHPRYNTLQNKTAGYGFWNVTKKSIGEPRSLFIIIGFTLFQVGYLYPFFYLQLDSSSHGLGASFSFYSIVIVNAGNFFGRALAGAALELIGIVDLTIIAIVACALLIIAMIWIGSIATFVTMGLLYGIFSGTAISMVAPMLELTSDPSDVGARIGVGIAISGVGGLVGSPICGALLTNQDVWWRPALFSAATLLLGGSFFLVVRLLPARTAIVEHQGATGDDSERPCNGESSSKKRE